jgi:general secretion pathway protein A
VFHDFYGLTALPFEERTAPDKLLADERFAKGLDRLDYFLQAGLAALVTGPTGVGKSSLLRLFLSRLAANQYHPILLQQTAMEAASLLRLLVRTLGEKPKCGKDRLFAQILDKTRAGDRIALLLVDEAHLLGEAALTDLRLLLAADEAPKLRLLLCGQEGLLHTLGRQSLADLLNRVSVRVHLAPLTKDQTACYLDHRLKSVGGSEKLFTDEAKARLHDLAGGLPRLLNNLATLCLVHAAAKKQKQITPPFVDAAAQELRLL